MEIVFLRQPYKFIKRADKNLKEKIKSEVLKIKETPFVGEKLKGKDFKGILSHHFVFTNVAYRIAYTVKNNLIIISIASRENFYCDLSL